MRKLFFRLPSAAVFLLLLTLTAEARTVKLFLIGNSFSQAAARYLPELAKDGGHELIIGRAELPGAPMETHWNAVVAEMADASDPKGKPYSGKTKSLRQLLSSNTWDIVTIQQASIQSSDVNTYEPYARQLRDLVTNLQPKAEVVMHQTWAYRNDEKVFAFTDKKAKKHARDQKEMWTTSRAAYHAVADELGLRLIPAGDAFWMADSDPKWGYREDKKFDFKKAVPPALPDQTHSLHAGYSWQKGTNVMAFDAHHPGPAGCYLAGLVWYGFLFGESPAKLTFVPPGVPADYAAHLRDVAAQILDAMPKKK